MENNIFVAAASWLRACIDVLPMGLGYFVFLPFALALIIYCFKKVFS